MAILNSVYKAFDADHIRSFFHQVFIAKTNKGHIQFIRYLFVGGFSALVNLGIFYILYSPLKVQYLFSELIAFIIATVVNYIFSVLWIFERSRYFKLEFALFSLVGVAGLGINELVLWISVSKFHLIKVFGEAIAIAAVTLWSFILRKMLFSKLNQTALNK